VVFVMRLSVSACSRWAGQHRTMYGIPRFMRQPAVVGSHGRARSFENGRLRREKAAPQQEYCRLSFWEPTEPQEGEG